MANVKVRTHHAKQGTLQTSVVGSDQLVISQPDPTSASGHRTVNITADESYNAIKETLKQTPNLIAIGEGLLGTGTPADPIRVDEDFLNRQWVNKRFTNFAQVGSRPGALLGSRSGPIFYWGGHPCYLAGIAQTIPAQSFDLTGVLSGVAGKTVYLYLVAVNGNLQFDWSFDIRADRDDSTYLARFTFGVDSQATTVIAEDGLQFIRFENYRLSEDNVSATKIRGGSYPVSIGAPFEVGYTLTGAAVSDSFTLAGVVRPGGSSKQNLWSGKTSDKIMVLGSEMLVSHIYGGIYLADELSDIKPSLMLKSAANIPRPPYLRLYANDGTFNSTILLARRTDTSVESAYSGFDLGTDHAKFDEIITRGITSTSMTVQVVGINQL